MRKVTVNMYKEAYRKAVRTMSDGKHVFADHRDHKLYQAVETDAKELAGSATATNAFVMGLETGFLLGVDAANPAATFVQQPLAPPAAPTKKSK